MDSTKSKLKSSLLYFFVLLLTAALAFYFGAANAATKPPFSVFVHGPGKTLTSEFIDEYTDKDEKSKQHFSTIKSSPRKTN